MIESKNKVVNANILNYVLYDDLDAENRVFVSWKCFEEAINNLHEQILAFQETNSLKFDGIYALPRGGLCLGVKLSYMTKLPLVTDASKITKNTLVVDDCTDTGATLSKFKDNITLVMFHKPTSCFKPTLFFQETEKQINFCWESKEERN